MTERFSKEDIVEAEIEQECPSCGKKHFSSSPHTECSSCKNKSRQVTQEREAREAATKRLNDFYDIAERYRQFLAHMQDALSKGYDKEGLKAVWGKNRSDLSQSFEAYSDIGSEYEKAVAEINATIASIETGLADAAAVQSKSPEKTAPRSTNEQLEELLGVWTKSRPQKLLSLDREVRNKVRKLIEKRLQELRAEEKRAGVSSALIDSVRQSCLRILTTIEKIEGKSVLDEYSQEELALVEKVIDSADILKKIGFGTKVIKDGVEYTVQEVPSKKRATERYKFQSPDGRVFYLDKIRLERLLESGSVEVKTRRKSQKGAADTERQEPAIASQTEHETPPVTVEVKELVVFDPLYGEALRIVSKTKNASPAYLRQHFKGMDYERAARICQRMEDDGVIGPPVVGRRREIRWTEERIEEYVRSHEFIGPEEPAREKETAPEKEPAVPVAHPEYVSVAEETAKQLDSLAEGEVLLNTINEVRYKVTQLPTEINSEKYKLESTETGRVGFFTREELAGKIAAGEFKIVEQEKTPLAAVGDVFYNRDLRQECRVIAVPTDQSGAYELLVEGTSQILRFSEEDMRAVLENGEMRLKDALAEAVAAAERILLEEQRALEENQKERDEIRKRMEEDDALIEQLRRKLAELENEEAPVTVEAKDQPPTKNLLDMSKLEYLEDRISKISQKIRELDEKIEKKVAEFEETKGWLNFFKRRGIEKEGARLLVEKEGYARERTSLERQKGYELEDIREKEERRQEQLRRKAEEEAAEQERARAIEEDKKKNPFKHYVIDVMWDVPFWIVFQKNRWEVSLEEINGICPEGTGDITFFPIEPEEVRSWRSDTVYFSSNGYSLQLENREEVQGAGRVDIKSPRARYALVSPSGQTSKGDLSYEEGIRLLEEEARAYQQHLVSQFAEIEQRAKKNGYGEQKADIEKRRLEELENPEVSVEDYINGDSALTDYGRELARKYEGSSLNNARLMVVRCFKYLRGEITERELLKEAPYYYNTDGLDEPALKKLAEEKIGPWKPKFDAINAKYDQELEGLTKEAQ